MNRRRFVQSSLAAAVAASLPASQGLAAILSGPMNTIDAVRKSTLLIAATT